MSVDSPGHGSLLRETLKGAAASSIMRVNPQCRFDKCLFILAHMRCGSTALSNILCSRFDVSGYGECHVRYDHDRALGALVLNHAVNRAWKPRARFLFDKILHSRHDEAASPAFFQARAIFLVREPASAIRSICTLFASLPKARRQEYDTPEKAAIYYVERLRTLQIAWHRFPAHRRFGLTYEELAATPGESLRRMSSQLSIVPPLKNHYRSLPASRRGGGGDPTRSGSLNRIERLDSRTASLTPPDVSLDVWTAAQANYAAIRKAFEVVSR